MENLSLLKALLLGVVQGLTEFLPVSSSGHLVLVQHFFHLSGGESVLAFDVALHFGTLLAVVVFFGRDLWEMARDSLAWLFGRRRTQECPGGRLTLLVGMATLPAVVVGLVFKRPIEELFVSPRVAGIGLLITGTVLWLTRKVGRPPAGEGKVSVLSALWVGVAQAVAITPGISRSGSTMAMGLFCRFDQVFAARFSFLMSIPAILGSVVLEGRELTNLGDPHLVSVVLGTLASAVTGFLAIKWLLRVIGRGRLYLFSYYCWAAGLAILLLV